MHMDAAKVVLPYRICGLCRLGCVVLVMQGRDRVCLEKALHNRIYCDGTTPLLFNRQFG